MRVPLEEFGTHRPLYNVLQHGSTLLGLALLVFWYWRWFKRTPPQPVPLYLQMSIGMKRWIVGSILALSASLAGVYAYFYSYHLASLGLFVGAFVVTCISLIYILDAWLQSLVASNGHSLGYQSLNSGRSSGSGCAQSFAVPLSKLLLFRCQQLPVMDRVRLLYDSHKRCELTLAFFHDEHRSLQPNHRGSRRARGQGKVRCRYRSRRLFAVPAHDHQCKHLGFRGSELHWLRASVVCCEVATGFAALACCSGMYLPNIPNAAKHP